MHLKGPINPVIKTQTSYTWDGDKFSFSNHSRRFVSSFFVNTLEPKTTLVAHASCQDYHWIHRHCEIRIPLSDNFTRLLMKRKLCALCTLVSSLLWSQCTFYICSFRVDYLKCTYVSIYMFPRVRVVHIRKYPLSLESTHMLTSRHTPGKSCLVSGVSEFLFG